jgi:hypothetical protein
MVSARKQGDLLMSDWDPIGVHGAAGADDECDGYLGPIAERLREGAEAERVAEYLSRVEREYMGLGASGRATGDLIPVGERLILWYRGIDCKVDQRPSS